MDKAIAKGLAETTQAKGSSSGGPFSKGPLPPLTPAEAFGSIDREPLAAASIGQVHCATTKQGERVIIKVGQARVPLSPPPRLCVCPSRRIPQLQTTLTRTWTYFWVQLAR
jgi:hypothetical protein